MINSYQKPDDRVKQEHKRKENLDKKALELIKYLDAPRYQAVAEKMIANLYRRRLGSE